LIGGGSGGLALAGVTDEGGSAGGCVGVIDAGEASGARAVSAACAWGIIRLGSEVGGENCTSKEIPG